VGYGPESGRGAPPEEEGKDPGKSWIQEEVDCRLQEGVLPCKSGMAKKKPLHKNWIQENCGSQKRVTVTDRKLIRYTGVVWLKEKVRTYYNGRKGLEDLGGRWPYLKN
jgi:hypothetical protein